MKSKKITLLFILLSAAVFALVFKQLTNPNYVYMCGKLYKTNCSELDIECHYKSCSDFENLKFFSSLEYLRISCLKSDKEFSFPVMNKLSYIRINNCDIKDTSFFNSLKNVKQMHILETKIDFLNFSNESIDNMEFILCDIENFNKVGICSNAEHLYIYGCEFKGTDKKSTYNSELYDSSVFSDFDKVNVLEIYATEINDISGFLDMQALKEIHFNTDQITNEQIIELENAGVTVYLHKPKYKI